MQKGGDVRKERRCYAIAAAHRVPRRAGLVCFQERIGAFRALGLRGGEEGCGASLRARGGRAVFPQLERLFAQAGVVETLVARHFAA